MLKGSCFTVRLSGPRTGVLTAGLLCAWLGGVQADETDACEAVNGVTPICGFQSPEDLEVMPGDRLIIVSEYGGPSGDKPGALSSYNTATGAIERLFPRPGAAVASPASESSMWGDKHCPGPPSAAFDPHGIHHDVDVSAERLLVVNHGGRESVEIFQVHLDDAGNKVSLTWRGCIVAAPGTWLNDVVGLPSGGLAVSNMMSRDLTREQFLEIDATKADSGYVLEWHSASGWRRVPGTDGALPNGIEASPDGRVLFVNHYLGGKIAAVERDTGARLWTIELDGPDNSSWAPDGKLLVATHQDSSLAEVLECAASDADYCPIAYEIMAIDPATGDHSVRYRGAGAPMAAVTVGVQIGQTLYLGSFAGKRMGRVELTP